MDTDKDTSLVPHHSINYTCSLTSKIFNEPVLASDNNVYEKQAILKWLSNEDTSPITGDLMDETLVDDEDMKKNVGIYLESNPEEKNNQYVLSKKFEDNIKNVNEILEKKEYLKLLNYTNYTLSKFFNLLTDTETFMKSELALIHIINNTENLGETIVNQWKLIHIICLYSTRLLNFVIKKGVNLNETEENGITPLHIVARKNNLQNVKLLIEAGADYLHICPEGWTILHYACKNCNLEMIKYLVELYENKESSYLEKPTGDGWYPIHFAFHGSFEIIKYFVEKRFNLNVYTDSNCSPLHIVCMTSTMDIIKYVLDQNVDTSKKVKKIYDKDVKCSYLDLIKMNENLTKEEKKILKYYNRISFKKIK